MMWLLWAVVRLVPQRDPGDAADLESVRRMAEGDGQALAALYDRHARVTYSLALRVLGEPLEAEEVVQDVFAQAWKQAARYDRSRGAVVAWLLMMTRSRAIDRVRARRAMPASSGDPDQAFGLIPDAADGPERVALTTERAARLKEAERLGFRRAVMPAASLKKEAATLPGAHGIDELLALVAEIAGPASQLEAAE